MGAGLSKQQRYNKIYSYLRTQHFYKYMVINHNLKRYFLKGINCYYLTTTGEYKKASYKWYSASNGECHAELLISDDCTIKGNDNKAKLQIGFIPGGI